MISSTSKRMWLHQYPSLESARAAVCDERHHKQVRLGLLLRERRQQAGLSREKLAELGKLSRSTRRNVETVRSVPLPPTIEPLCKLPALGLSASDGATLRKLSAEIRLGSAFITTASANATASNPPRKERRPAPPNAVPDAVGTLPRLPGSNRPALPLARQANEIASSQPPQIALARHKESMYGISWLFGEDAVAEESDRFSPKTQVGGTDWESRDRSRAARSSHRLVMGRGRLALPQLRPDSSKHCTLNCRRSVLELPGPHLGSVLSFTSKHRSEAPLRAPAVLSAGPRWSPVRRFPSGSSGGRACPTKKLTDQADKTACPPIGLANRLPCQETSSCERLPMGEGLPMTILPYTDRIQTVLNDPIPPSPGGGQLRACLFILPVGLVTTPRPPDDHAVTPPNLLMKRPHPKPCRVRCPRGAGHRWAYWSSSRAPSYSPISPITPSGFPVNR